MGHVHASPPVNFIQNRFTSRLSMLFFKIVHDPLNKVVFEHAFDELVKQIWGDEFIDVRMGKMFGERLEGESDKAHQTDRLATYNHVINNLIFFPHRLGIKCRLACMGVLLRPWYGVRSVEVSGGGGATEKTGEIWK